MAELPTADEFFGPPKQLPTADEFFGKPYRTLDYGSGFGSEIPTMITSSDEANQFLDNTSVGRIMRAFGHGFGSDMPGMSQAHIDEMRKYGVFNNYAEGERNLGKALNEAIIRPAAVAFDIFNRSASATIGTAVYAGERTPYIGKYVGAGIEAAVDPGFQASLMGAGPIGEATALGLKAFGHFLPPYLADARSLKVIGAGEDGWKGTAAPKPAEAFDHEAEAIKAQVEAQTHAQEAQGVKPGEPQPTVAEQKPKPTIDEVARQINPIVMQQADALDVRMNTFRRWIQELDEKRTQDAEAPFADEIADLQNRLADPETTNRLAKKYRARLEEIGDKIDEATQGDSPDMAKVRQHLMDTFHERAELGRQVAQVYAEARQRMGGAEVPEEVAPQPQEIAAQPTAEVTPAAEAKPETIPELPIAQETAKEEPQKPSVTTPQQVTSITDDVSKKLVAAGRPADEANAAAQLIASHYWARAQRFNGAKGTGLDLYKAEAPEIRAGRSRRAASLELAQRKGAELYQRTRAGKINIVNDAKNVITLFDRADASTFIHETGHQWLEELMSDAADEKAPPDLIADAKTVRDWLGAKDGEPITTRQHEQFARGFETYIMEGRAPTARLAKVFEQFRQWLTAIYQTVARLRSPINDDIRGVFDRLVVAKPERVTIAPDRETAANFADLHDADVEATPPGQERPAANVVQNERDRVAGAAVPEEQDARLENIAAGAGRREAGSPQLNRNPNEARPLGGETGNPPPSGEVGAGGSEAAAAGARPREDAAEQRTEQPASAHAEIKDKEGFKFVDKAGNFRLENINVADDVKQAIRDSVDRNNEFIEDRRGVLTDAQAFSLADAMGMKPSDLDRRQIGQAFNKEQIISLERLFIQAATNVRDAAKAAAEAGTDEAMLAYGEAEARHQMILDSIARHAAGVRAEAGRALQAYNALKKMQGHGEAEAIANMLRDTTGRTLFQLRQRANAIANLDTPAKVAGAVNEMNKPGLGAMILEIFKNWLISGPITHTTYAIGNATLALWKAVPETAAEATVGAIRNAVTGAAEDRVRFGEVGAQLYAMFKGQRDGWKAAYDSLRAGQTMPLPHEMLDKLTEKQREKFEQSIAEGKSYEEAIGEFGYSGAQTPFTNTQAVPNFQVGNVSVPLGSIVRFPGERMVAPIHSYFRTIGYIQGVARQAYRTASQEGLTGDAFNRRVAELTTRPTEDMMKKARFEATEQTLMGKGGELTKRVSHFMSWEPNLPLLGPTKVFGFINPFVHIASNIMEQAVLERGPLGALTQKTRQDLAGLNGNAVRDTTIARLALGTSLTTVGIGLAMEGFLNPSAPSDPKERAVWTLNHGLPHSFRIGETSIDLSRLGVLGFQLGIAADLWRMIDHIGKDDISTVASLLVHSFAQNFMDEGFMRGPSDLIKALDDPDRYGGRYIQNLASSLAVPFSIGMSQIARQVDPYAREARTFMDSLIAKIPFASESLYPYRDLWGQPVPNREYFGVYARHVDTDPVNQALERLKYYPARPLRKIRGIELTDQQYDDYQRISGTSAKMLLNNLVNTPGFNVLPPGVQIEQIKRIITSARERARSVVMMQNPDIITKALANKKAVLEPVH